MRLARSLGCFALCAAAVSSALSQTVWRHERLQSELLYVDLNHTSAVSPTGAAAYTAFGPLGRNVFLGSVNYSSQIYEGPHTAELRGITDDGLPIWKTGHLFVGLENITKPRDHGVYRVPFQSGVEGHFSYTGYVWGGPNVAVVDGRDVTTEALGETGEADLTRAPNASGLIGWRGRGPGTEGYWDIFSETRNLSRELLGADRSAWPIGMDDAGRLLWNGSGANTDRHLHVYVDDVDVGGGIGRAINRAGQVLWENVAVMLDDVNISEPVVGSGVQVLAYGLSENGHVLWSAMSQDAGRELYLDAFSLTGAVFSKAPFTGRKYISRTGHAAWAGMDFVLRDRYDVFFDTFNLTRDALGETRLSSEVLAVGPNRHVLWTTENPDVAYRWDVWLSTPVPEPSMLLLALPILLLLRRRR